MSTAPALPEPPWRTPRKDPANRRTLSREAIVGAALKVLKAEGIDAVSMRRVATELGTGAASLYAHVANKDELLALVFDEVAGEIVLPEPDPRRWREQVTELWTESRAVMARNGDIARVAIGAVPMGPNSLRLAEATTAILRAGGVPPRPAAWAVDIIGMFVAASAIEFAQHERAGVDQEAYYRQVADYFRSLPPELFPVLASLSGDLTSGDADERFAFGLRLLVGGLAAEADAAAARTS
ncbi:TetR/AcrR family transcriptional regulator [Pseudonocardia sp.]|jgi:AcrR family transcriptional regulator|uniref:TetR/AcrR family transcriptional regulator n=1 Tax=Pseudonocardia sp. TaxID=60912 RepID=UPI003D10BAEC